MARSPEQPTFFVDRCLGTVDVPNALREAGALVAVHDDHFPQDCTDEAWLPMVGKKGGAVLTTDKWIRRNELERAALESARVAAFVLSAGDLRGQEIGAAFVAALRKMERLLWKWDRPPIARVSRGGQVQVLVGKRRGGISRVEDQQGPLLLEVHCLYPLQARDERQDPLVFVPVGRQEGEAASFSRTALTRQQRLLEEEPDGADDSAEIRP